MTILAGIVHFNDALQLRDLCLELAVLYTTPQSRLVRHLRCIGRRAAYLLQYALAKLSRAPVPLGSALSVGERAKVWHSLKDSGSGSNIKARLSKFSQSPKK